MGDETDERIAYGITTKSISIQLVALASRAVGTLSGHRARKQRSARLSSSLKASTDPVAGL